MQDNKVEYFSLCEKENDIPIFMQPHWLDAVCTEGVSWDVVLVIDNGNITSALVFCTQKKWGIQRITMPHLTQFLGIWINEKLCQNQKDIQQYKQNQTTQLIAQLPHYQHFILRTHFNFTDWLPFYWAEFQQTTRYTYVLTDIKNTESIFNNFSDNIKRDIKQATQKYTVEKRDDFDLFLKLKNKNDTTPLSIWRNLEAVLKEKNQRSIYFAVNEKGEAEATAYIIWDKNTAYYLASGTNEMGKKYNAGRLLIWQTIQDTSQHANIFDFEGSMLEGVESFFRRFGAIQKPYFQITKFNSKALKLLYVLMGKL